jgi:ribosomal protein L25 (general stress protein Ctc)
MDINLFRKALASRQKLLTEALVTLNSHDIDLVLAPMRQGLRDLNSVWKKHGSALMSGKGGVAGRSKVAAVMKKEFSAAIRKHQSLTSPIKIISSAQLTTDAAQKAHEKHPLTIFVYLIGPSGRNNHYVHGAREVHICLESNTVIDLLHNLDTVPANALNYLKDDLSEAKYRGIIQQVITSWISESLR